MKLNSIDCVKGVLKKKDHLILQYTGLKHKNDVEIYEKDILMFGVDKFVILWDEDSFS